MPSGSDPDSPRFLQRGRDLGSVEEGKLADLIVVDGDPAEDIRAARNVDRIIVGGRMIDPNQVRKLPPPVPDSR